MTARSYEKLADKAFVSSGPSRTPSAGLSRGKGDEAHLPDLHKFASDDEEAWVKDFDREHHSKRQDYESKKAADNYKKREHVLAGMRGKVNLKEPRELKCEAGRITDDGRRRILRMLGFQDKFDRLLSIVASDDEEDESDLQLSPAPERIVPKQEMKRESKPPLRTNDQRDEPIAIDGTCTCLITLLADFDQAFSLSTDSETESEGELLLRQKNFSVQAKVKPEADKARPSMAATSLQNGLQSGCDTSGAQESVHHKSNTMNAILIGVNEEESSDSDAEIIEYRRWKKEESKHAVATKSQQRAESPLVLRESKATEASPWSDDDVNEFELLKRARAQELAEPTSRNSMSLGAEDVASDRNMMDPVSGTQDRTRRPDFPVLDQQRKQQMNILDSVQGIAVPDPINWFLRDYQRQGVRFLFKLYRKGRGGILADDMGLGKTIQVIALLTAIMRHTGFEDTDARRRLKKLKELSNDDFKNEVKDWPTALIICPATLRQNWVNEIQKWCYLEVGVCGMNAVQTREALKDFRRGRLDVLVAGLEHVRDHIDDFASSDFSAVIVDEAHRINNSGSTLHRNLSKLPCLVRLALTGTPFMNRYEELWELLRWTNPGDFPSKKAWSLDVAIPIVEGQSTSATDLQVSGGRIVAQRLVTRLLPPFLLRRTKELLVDVIPPKVDYVVVCEMSEEQRKIYKRIWAEPEIQAIIHAREPCPCGKMFEVQTDDGVVLQRRTRKICCDRLFFSHLKKRLGEDEDEETASREAPAWEEYTKLRVAGEVSGEDYRVVGLAEYPMKYQAILMDVATHLALAFPDKRDQKSNDPADRERYRRQLEYVQKLYPDDWQARIQQSNVGDRPEYCGKWRVMKELLKAWKKEGAKVLIFSRRIGVLDYIAAYIEMEAHEYRRLDGSTPQMKRQANVDQFNNDPSIFIFLISIAAGGVGLNLTSANKVIIFDPSWTPALDMQAMDRAHRTGQKRKVEVYRLLSQGTLEERIYERQLYKMAHANIALEGRSEQRIFEGRQGDYLHQGELFGWKNLFNYRDQQRVGLIVQEAKIVQEVEGAKIVEDPLSGDKAYDAEENEIDRAWKKEMHKSVDAVTDAGDKGGVGKNMTRKAEIDSILSKSDISLVHATADIVGGKKPARLEQEADADFDTFFEYWKERLEREEVDKEKEKKKKKTRRGVKEDEPVVAAAARQSSGDSFAQGSFVPDSKVAAEFIEAERKKGAEAKKSDKKRKRSTKPDEKVETPARAWPPPRRRMNE